MLILSRRPNEKIRFPGINAVVQVVAIKPGVVRLGVEAPPEVTVLREEVANQPHAQHHLEPPRGAAGPGELTHLVCNRVNAATFDLALLRRQLQAGWTEASEAILNKVDQDIRALRQRLNSAAARAPARVPNKPAKTRRALLVEDDRNERELLAGFLRLGGLEVDTVGDGLDALDYLHAGGRPDVVLLDMGLPRCDGPSTARQIRRDPAHAALKIFAVTGHSVDEFGGEAAHLSIDRWFHKPLDPRALLQDLQQELAAVA